MCGVWGVISNNQLFSCARPLLPRLTMTSGLGVSWLWEHGITAVGVDISKTAVAMANRSRTRLRLCGPHPCFQVGQALKLPLRGYTLKRIQRPLVPRVAYPDT